MTPIPTAIITGAHPFDVINFHHLLRALPNIDPYLQHVEDFSAASPETRASYKLLIFYTHVLDHTTGNVFLKTENLHAMADQLGTTSQGIIILHHGLVAFPDWPLWDSLTGLSNRTLDAYSHNESIPVTIADPDHPITADLQNWTFIDETYLMNNPTPEDGNHILLTTDHPQSMKPLAWTRQYKQSRVICIQPGHGNTSWSDSNFRQLLSQAINWCNVS